MRPHELSAILRNGIRPDSRLPVGSPFASRMLNTKPMPWGTALPETIIQPVTDYTPVISWPTPVLFRGEDASYIFEASEVHLVTEATWTSAQITTYDIASIATPKALTGAAAPWHIADFHRTFFASNGVDLLINLPLNGFVTAVSNNPTVGALARSHNRLYLGGMAGAWFSNQRWLDLFAVWKEHAADTDVTYDGLDHSTKFVMWSERVGGDIYQPFRVLLACLGMMTSTDFDSVREQIFSLIKKGEVGLKPMAWQGTVRGIAELGAYTIVYGADGVEALDSRHNSIPLVETGIAGRGCFGGSNQTQYFLDREGVLWMLDAGLHISRLGYEEHFDRLTLANVVMSYDIQQGDLYIADGLIGFIKTPSGICEHYIMPTRLSRTSAGLVGIFEDSLNFYGPQHLTDSTFVGGGTDWNANTGWTIDLLGGNHEFDHTPGNTEALTQLFVDFAVPVVTGFEYEVSVIIKDRTVGSVAVMFGKATSILGGFTASANGSTEGVLRPVAGDDRILLVPSSDFDGAIDGVNVFRVSTSSFVLETMPFKAPYGVETLESVQLVGNNIKGVSIDIEYRYHDAIDWTLANTTSLMVDARGFVRKLVTGVEFKLRLHTTNPEDLVLSELIVFFRDGSKLNLKDRLSA